VYRERSTGIAHAGDMVAGEGTVLIDPHDDGDMAQYLRSLGRLEAAGATRLVPAHGPVLDDPVGVCRHYVAHRLGREAKVLAAIDRGGRDFGDVLAQAYADTPRVLWRLAVRSLEAHLRKLVDEGAIERDGACVRRVG
jgi:glyoxylase-like metal-dependent hydrolase (beta-lactamase superfamily II)